MKAHAKMGFWTLFGIITGSQIGSGALLLPAKLAGYGPISLLGWTGSALGSIALALVFARLSGRKHKKGGPHALIYDSLGHEVAYFVGWTYWVIAWASMSAVVHACSGYLAAFLNLPPRPVVLLSLDALILLGVFLANWFGIGIASRLELLLTTVKFIPLAFIPLFCFVFLTKEQFATNFMEVPQFSEGLPAVVSQIILLTLWGFVGFETGTAPAESVHNPHRTIPQAIVASTIVVALVYIFNNVGLASFMPRSELLGSDAPYALVTNRLFNSPVLASMVSLISAIICFGTFNAWILASTQIALNLEKDHFLPSWLGVKNKYGIPAYSLIIAVVGIGLILAALSTGKGDTLIVAVTYAVTSFLIIYLITCLAALLDHVRKRDVMKPLTLAYHVVALTFCAWVLLKNPISNTLYSFLVPLSGVPFFLRNRKRMKDLHMQEVV